MLKPIYKNIFKRDLKRVKKRGKDVEELYEVINNLISGKTLDKKYLDHPLKGDYTDCRECHIEPDWLLIYILENQTITFLRTGTHSDLFR